jgi:hypothetical protein
MNDVDKLTLELFTNKTQYKKYLSKINPEKYNKIEQFREKCIENKDKILEKTEYLLLNHHFHSNLIEEPFYRYVDEIIKEIENEKEKEKEKEKENEQNVNRYDSENLIYEDGDRDRDEDDVLFPPDNMIENNKYETNIEESPIERHSFWGKERVIQRNSDGGFISHYPTNTSVRRRFIGRRNSILPNDK